MSLEKKAKCKICGNECKLHGAKYCSVKCYRYRNLSVSPDGVISKKCTKCGETKLLNLENYNRSKDTSDGFGSHCKTCGKLKNEKWRNTPRGKLLKQEGAKRYQKSDALKKYREKMKPERRISENIRRKTDLAFALKNRVRILMYASLRQTKNGRKWQKLVGYSIEQLRRHIEKHFTEGMSWERFLAGEIHIDHKIPVSAFNFTKPEHMDFKKCWALKNLQPMWAGDNISKGNNLEKPFQPALAFGGVL